MGKITKEYIVSLLHKNNIEIADEKRMVNDLGFVIKTTEGCIINVYDSGTVNCQGKNKEVVETLLKNTQPLPANRKVFVVYGHDKDSRIQLEAMLRRWDLEPIIIDQLVSSGNTIIEKLEEYTKDVYFGIVLATPDDVGYPRDNEDIKKYRVRQNVVLELGMLLSLVGRSKIAILLSQAEDMERPSDIEGLIYIPFKDSVEETTISLAKELKRNGYKLDIEKL